MPGVRVGPGLDGPITAPRGREPGFPQDHIPQSPGKTGSGRLQTVSLHAGTTFRIMILPGTTIARIFSI